VRITTNIARLVRNSFLVAHGDDLVESILEKESFQAISRMTRRAASRERLSLGDICAFCEDVQW